MRSSLLIALLILVHNTYAGEYSPPANQQPLTQPSQPTTQPSDSTYTPPTQQPPTQPSQPTTNQPQFVQQPTQPITQPDQPSSPYTAPTTQPSQPGSYTLVDITGCNQNYLIHESVSQSFMPPAGGPISAISIWIKPHSCYDTSYTVDILQGDDLSSPIVLATSAQVDIQASLSGGLAQWYSFSFNNVTLVGGTRYIWRLVKESTYYGAISVCTDVYAGGSAFGQNNQPNPYRDCSFGISMTLPAGNPCENSHCVSGASCIDNGPIFTCKCADDLVGDGMPSGTGCTPQCPVPTALETIDAPILNVNASGFSSQNIFSIVWDVPVVQTRTDNEIEFVLPDNSVAQDCPLSDTELDVTGSCMKQLTLNLPWTDATSKCGCHLTGQVGSGYNAKDVYACRIRFTADEDVEDGLGSAHTREIVNEFNILVTFDSYATVSTDIKVFCAVVVDAVLTKQHYGTEQPDAGFFEFETNVGYPFQLVLASEDTELTGSYPDTIESTELTELSSTPATTFGALSTQSWKVVIKPKADTCELDGEYVTGDNQFQLECTDAAISANDCPSNIDHYVVLSFKLDSSNYCGQIVADVGVVLAMKSHSDSAYSDDMDVFFVGEDETAYFQVSVASSPQVSVSSLEVVRVVISSCGLSSCHAANVSGRVLYDNGVTAEGDDFSFTANEDTFSFAVTEKFNVEPTTFDSVSVVALVKVNYEGNDGQKRNILAIAQDITPGETNMHADHDISISTHSDGKSGATTIVGSLSAIFLLVVMLFF